MDSNITEQEKITREKAIDEICDKIQIFCAEEEVQKAYGKIEDENKRDFVTRIYEYIHEIEERNEEMTEELEFRESLLNYFGTLEEINPPMKREIVRTKEICTSLKTTIALNEAKIKVFKENTVKDILDNYALLGRVNMLLGNPLAMGEYNRLQSEISERVAEEYTDK